MPGFYDTAHLHIGFNVSSLTEIQYLEMNTWAMNTYQWNHDALQWNELLQSKMNQKLSTISKITCIAAISDKKISVFCVPGVLYSLLHSAFKLNSFFRLALDFVENLEMLHILGGRGGGGGWDHIIYVIMIHCVRKSICDSPFSFTPTYPCTLSEVTLNKHCLTT